jgi:hypothetical protein
MISLDQDDELDKRLRCRMERTEKHVNPRSEGDMNVVKTATPRSLDRPFVVIVCPDLNDRSA